MEIIGIAGFFLAIFAIFNVITSSASTGAKIGWSIGLILLPVIGFVVWMIAGPRGGTRAPA